MRWWRMLADLIGLRGTGDSPDVQSGLATELERQRATLTELAARRADHEGNIERLRAELALGDAASGSPGLDAALENELESLAAVKRRQRGLKQLRDSAVTGPATPARVEPRAPTATLAPPEPGVAELMQRLERHAQRPALAALAGAALQQIEGIRSAIATYTRVLVARLERSEITFARYQAAANAVEEGVFLNLRAAAEALDVLAEVEAQNAIGAGGAGTTASAERRPLIESGTQRIDGLLADNDEAINALFAATQAVTDLRPLDARPNVDLDSAMQELEELANRAHRYR